MSESPQTKAMERAGKGGIVPPVEHRIKPGQVLNPGGMPKGTKQIRKRLRNAMLKKLKARPEDIDAVAEALIQEAMTRPRTERVGDSVVTEGSGWAQAQKLIWDRLDGPIVQKSDLNVNVRFEKRMHDDEDYGNDSP